MKKMRFIIILLLIVIFNPSVASNTQFLEPDFSDQLEGHSSIMFLIDTQTGSIEYVDQAAAKFNGYVIEQQEFNLFSTINDVIVKTQREETNLMNNVLYDPGLIIIISLIYFVFLFKKNKKLKIKTDEIAVFNELRKTFINADLVDVFTHDFNSFHEQLEYVLNKALELTESKFGYIYLYNEENKEFTLNTWSKDVMADCQIVEKHTKYQLEKTGLWDEVVRQRKPIVVNNFEMPNVMKKGYPEGHVILSKFMTFPVIIDNEIMAVVGLANKEEDYGDNDVFQSTLLMTGVWNAKERRERTLELEKANIDLFESKDALKLILNSTAEAIYGIDKNGNCTFCNDSCLKLLGYTHKDELIGNNMHVQIHHSYQDASPMPIEECSVVKTLETGEGTNVDDEVFWRKNGTSFAVKYFSYPQYKDGKIIGAVVTFLDITNNKKAEEEIKHLTYHDSLTGLYNHMFFKEELSKLDTESNLPISIIVGDVNGLKLTNDIFGHAAGDTLLKKVAEILKKVCRKDDIITRVGGDEFTILMPKTGAKEAEKIIRTIKNEFSKVKIDAIKCSISLGSDTKVSTDQDITSIIEAADDKMYLEKTINRKSMNENQIKIIIETLHEICPREEKHSINVSEISEKIGRKMNLTEVELKRLKEAAFLHDIGKIVLDENIILKLDTFTNKETKAIKQHAVVGYRILNSFDNTIDLAETVFAHHESWDGSGYPKGLKGEEIPKLARIIAVAESYDSSTNEINQYVMRKEDARKEIVKKSGTKFDPEIVDIFIGLMS